MAYYLDTSAPGGPGPITATGPVFTFGGEVPFYLTAASNFLANQASGPAVTFTIYSKKNGVTTVTVDYGTVNSNWNAQLSGYMVEVAVPTGAGSVNVRVVLDNKPVPLTIQTIGVAEGESIDTVATSPKGFNTQTLGFWTGAADDFPADGVNGEAPDVGWVDILVTTIYDAAPAGQGPAGGYEGPGATSQSTFIIPAVSGTAGSESAYPAGIVFQESFPCVGGDTFYVNSLNGAGGDNNPSAVIIRWRPQ